MGAMLESDGLRLLRETQAEGGEDVSKRGLRHLIAFLWLDFADWFYGQAQDYWDRVFLDETEHHIEVPP